MITEDELSKLVEQARPGDLQMGLVSDEQRPEAFDIVRRAMKIEADDYELYDETRLWFRFSKREIKRHRDGLSVNTAGLTGFSAGAANMFLSSRNWHKEKNRERYLETFGKTVESTRGLLTMITPTNTMFDWLHAGRVYVRAQLAASALGLRFHHSIRFWGCIRLRRFRCSCGWGAPQRRASRLGGGWTLFSSDHFARGKNRTMYANPLQACA
jgi:hypothetical protein